MAMVMENQQPLARMPLVPPPPPPVLPQAYKHRCRVCKKGFMCGRALGGHMRAHGVVDDGLSDDDALGVSLVGCWSHCMSAMDRWPQLPEELSSSGRRLKCRGSADACGEMKVMRAHM